MSIKVKHYRLINETSFRRLDSALRKGRTIAGQKDVDDIAIVLEDGAIVSFYTKEAPVSIWESTKKEEKQ